MSDLRLFCWGLFGGMGSVAIAFNSGWERASDAMTTPGEALIAVGLATGAIAVLSFGHRAKGTNHDRD